MKGMSAVKMSSLGRRGGVIAVADGAESADGAEGAAEAEAAEAEAAEAEAAEVEAAEAEAEVAAAAETVAAPLSKCLLKKNSRSVGSS